LVEIVQAEGAGKGVYELYVGGRGGREDIGEVEFEEVGGAQDGLFVDVADYGLEMPISWFLGEGMDGHTRMRNTIDIKKKRLAMMMAWRRVDVAFLISTPGVYVGVTVRSEESFSLVTPSGLSSFEDFFSCLRAARLLNVGRAIARIGTWPTEGRCETTRATSDDKSNQRRQEQPATTRATSDDKSNQRRRSWKEKCR
jgi:hypothetical protein